MQMVRAYYDNQESTVVRIYPLLQYTSVGWFVYNITNCLYLRLPSRLILPAPQLQSIFVVQDASVLWIRL